MSLEFETELIYYVLLEVVFANESGLKLHKSDCKTFIWAVLS